jgi:hypothetical protein
MFIFEKHAEPLTLEQKFKLRLIGTYNVNEEVKTATFGSLRLAQKKQDSQIYSLETSVANKKKLVYSSLYAAGSLNSLPADVEMSTDVEEMKFDEKFELQMRTDLTFAKKIFE